MTDAEAMMTLAERDGCEGAFDICRAIHAAKGGG